MIHSRLARVFRKSAGRRTTNFTRRMLQPESLEDRRVLAVITGSVVDDLNANGQIEAGEPGMDGVEVYLDANQNEMLDISGIVVEPDHFAANDLIVVPGVSLAVQTSTSLETDAIIAIAETPSTGEFASTGKLVFGVGENDFFNEFGKLRMSFEEAVRSVTIDVIGSSQFAQDVGVLEAYDSNDNLLASVSSDGLCASAACTTQIETIRIDRPEGDIAYALAFTKLERLTARFDSLRINDGGSEIWTLTNSQGSYTLRGLDSGTYQVNQVVPAGYGQTLPNSGGQEVVITDGDVMDVNFANHEQASVAVWQNPDNPLDVNDDESVSPIDALQIINELNDPTYHDAATGQLQDPAPTPIPAYFDVDGDGFISPRDALRVINAINEATEASLNAAAESSETKSTFATPVFIDATPRSTHGESKRLQTTLQSSTSSSVVSIDAMPLQELDLIFQQQTDPSSGTPSEGHEIDDSLVLELAQQLPHGTI